MSLRKLRKGGKAVTVLLLIILPSIFLSLLASFVATNYYYNTSSESGVTSTIGVFGNFIVGGIAFFWYIPYHTIDKPEKYFNKNGLVQAAIEYQFSRKLLKVTAAVSVFSILGPIMDVYVFDVSLYIIALILFCALVVCSFATLTLVIRFALQHRRKDFGFYLSRAYFMVSSQKQDSVEKLRYLTLTLDTYNRFLERNLKLKIKDIMRIYSLIMSASAEEKIKIRESISKALEKDKLELARQLAEISHLPDEEEFLRNEHVLLNQQLKDILTIIIPAIISIVGFIIAILSQARILA